MLFLLLMPRGIAFVGRSIPGYWLSRLQRVLQDAVSIRGFLNVWAMDAEHTSLLVSVFLNLRSSVCASGAAGLWLNKTNGRLCGERFVVRLAHGRHLHETEAQ